VVLDTDLGSDVDDALALAVLLGSAEVDLLGATTVYGDVELRAKLLAGFAALAGVHVPCRPGQAEPLSGAPVWLSGEEGAHFPDLDRVLAKAEADPEPALDGVEWLVEQGRTTAGRLEVVAIGPLTNLALAVRHDPAFVGNVRRVWLMGGCFAPDAEREAPEHNFRADAVAADEVIRSGLPITVLGVELTRQLRLGDTEVAELGAGGHPLGVQLEREARAWMAYWNEPHDVPHDAVAVIRMLRPELFTSRTAWIRVEPGGARAGQVVPCASVVPRSSPVELVTGLDVPAVTREILDRIRAAAVRGPRASPGERRGERCAT
jgi:purine nucleosidase